MRLGKGIFEIRFHGRGGQGTVLAAKMLADAVLRSGQGECLAMPEFGVERRGAPVTAYARISASKIRVRTRIYDPDVVVLMDPTLAIGGAVVQGLKKDGTLVVNTDQSPEELADRWPGVNIRTVPARRIALAHKLGSAASPVVNTAMLGALCALFGLADRDSMEGAVRGSVPAKVKDNIAAAHEAYQSCLSEDAHAPA